MPHATIADFAASLLALLDMDNAEQLQALAAPAFYPGKTPAPDADDRAGQARAYLAAAALKAFQRALDAEATAATCLDELTVCLDDERRWAVGQHRPRHASPLVAAVRQYDILCRRADREVVAFSMAAHGLRPLLGLAPRNVTA